MYIIACIAALPFLLIGGRLLRVATRSGATPDKLLTAFFLLIGLAVPLRLIVVDLLTNAGRSDTTYWLTTAGNVVLGTALSCLAAFTWRVFRAQQPWGRWLFLGLSCGILVTALAAALVGESKEASASILIVITAIGHSTLLWTFVECLLHYRRMRRRVSLGLADPVVANRFLLWSIWTGALVVQTGLQLGTRLALWVTGDDMVIASGQDPGESWLAVIAFVKGALIVVAPTVFVSVGLSFSPPGAYRRWLEQRAATS